MNVDTKKEYFYLLVEIWHLNSREGCWVVFYCKQIPHLNQLKPPTIFHEGVFL